MEKKKRTQCMSSGCKERWAIRIEVLVGETGGSQWLKGKFCKEHAMAVRGRYVNFLESSLELELARQESP